MTNLEPVRHPTNQMQKTEDDKCAARVEGEYSFGFLQEITQGFSDHNLLGEGGFGKVYKGKLPDGTEVAVKRMNPSLDADGLKGFEAELSVLKMSHSHVVAILGFCKEGVERLLMYEYMGNGTLHDKLFEETTNPMSWEQRMVVALDVAKGLDYLHGLARKTYIHRDVKAKNILLDSNMRAKIADYGLVKNAPGPEESLVTRVAGTHGYIAPEYASTGHVSVKTDVYAYGIVLLELVTGQKTLDKKTRPGKNLAQWFRAVHTGEHLRDLVDRRMDPDDHSLMEMVRLAFDCTRNAPSDRPDFREITARLGVLVEKWPQRGDEEEEEAPLDIERLLQEMRHGPEGDARLSTTDYHSSRDLEQGHVDDDSRFYTGYSSL
ncbi:hypothetical protein MKX03_006602 [Papaver bracteatum]|nr:hypothetical protein MKX03_006602 [Papaver bracteatum]